MSFKNAQAYNDWHEWVESLSNYEKGLPDEPLGVVYVSTRFDIKHLETQELKC